MSEDFEKWFNERFENFNTDNVISAEFEKGKSNMKYGFEAARELDAKRIVELEREVYIGIGAGDLLSKVLAEICITLKGEPPYLKLFSYHDIPKLVAELESQNKAMREAAKLTYGYLWHVNAGLDAPTILNMKSITPEKCSYLCRKLWLDILTSEERGAGINNALAILDKEG